MCIFEHKESVGEYCDYDDDDDYSDDDTIGNDGINFEEIKPALDEFMQAVDNFEQLLEKHGLKVQRM